MLPMAEIRKVYPAVGDAGFRTLVDAFYRSVEADPVLRPMFPLSLAAARERQLLFLRQIFGGPNDYSERRGAPQLRMRHMPFPITRAARDAWLGHMLAAIDEAKIPEPHASVMRDYFERFSLDMINSPADEAPSAHPMRPLHVRQTGQRLDVVE
jgi:hemoglobin